MSILTHLMKTDRDVRRTSACKLFWTHNDGSGSTFTDEINGSIITKGQGAAVAWDVPHTADYGVSSGAITGSAFPEATTQAILVGVQIVRTAASFVIFKLGGDTHISCTSGIAIFSTLGGGDNSVQTASNVVGVADQVLLSAAVLKGNTLKHYTSVNGGAITENGTIDATAFRALHPTTFAIDDFATIGSTALLQDIYGMALFTYTEADMPSLATIQTALAEIETNWKAGKKYLPESLL